MKKILLLIALISYTFMGAQVISSVDFEDGTAGTWSFVQSNPSQTWGVTTGAAAIAYDPALVLQDERIVSPAMDFTSVLATTNVTFSYNMSYHWGVAPNNNYDVNLLVSTDGGMSWNEIWDETQDVNFTSTADNFIWRTITVNLASYNGQSDVRLSFQYLGTDGAGAGIDSVIVSNDLPVAVNAPSPVTNLTPLDGAVDVYVDPADNGPNGVPDGAPDNGVAFDWDPSILGDAATSYDVYLGNSVLTLALLGNTANDAVTITGMTYDTQYFWQIIAKNAGGDAVGSSIWSFTTQSDPALSTNQDILSKDVNVYPSTVDSQFTIENNSSIALIEANIIDVNGRLVVKHNLNELVGTTKINVSNLNAGLYFVELNSNSTKLVKKIVKK